MTKFEPLSPKTIRSRCRNGTFSGPTSGHAPGAVQANVVILPVTYAKDFETFCKLNTKPCPILEILSAGDFHIKVIAPNADVRTDLPRYSVFRNGELVDQPLNVLDIWEDNLVTFLLGCSFIAEEALLSNGLVLPHITETGFVPMYRTNVPCKPAGIFKGNLVVSMRPFIMKDAQLAAEITQHYPMAHGAPLHIGDPSFLGIKDLDRPDFGEPVTMKEEQVPVFWACGVTPQNALASARPSLAITHAPGHMFVADITSESTRV